MKIDGVLSKHIIIDADPEEVLISLFKYLGFSIDYYKEYTIVDNKIFKNYTQYYGSRSSVVSEFVSDDPKMIELLKAFIVIQNRISDKKYNKEL